MRGAGDDQRVVVRVRGDDLQHLLVLGQAEVVAAGHVDQDALGALDARVLEQRVVDGVGGRVDRPVVARARCRCPSGRRPLPFMIVRTSAKSMLISPGSVIRSEMPCTPWRSTSSAMKKASRIGVRFSAIFSRCWLGMVIRVSTSWRRRCDALLGQLHLALALEVEGLGHHGHGEGAQLPGDAGHHRRAARARAAAHAGGDEDHVRALQEVLDALLVLERGLLADLGHAAGPQAAGELGADGEPGLGVGVVQGLLVGVDRRRTDTFFRPIGDHAVDGIGAAPAHADRP